jgi:GTP-sensing pleiotropic transcriptional regulator CodY
MNRTEEIQTILKHLLGEVNHALDGRRLSNHLFQILECTKNILNISKQIEIYVNELEEIREKNDKQND